MNNGSRPRPLSNNSRLRRFCFTLNNFTEEEYKNLIEDFCQYCSWMVVGKEHIVGDGTPHLQGI